MSFVSLSVPAAFAQDGSTDAPPAHIAFVDGAVVLERDGRRDASPASMPLLAGDRIRTESGRVEVLFADGSALHIDNHTVIDFQSDEVVRLIDGRLRLSIAGQGRVVAYRVDAPGGWIQIAEAGEYRIAVLRGEREPQVELAVLRGGAELVNEEGRSFVRAGERAFARAGARPSPPYVFNSAAWDAFDRWSEARRDQRLGASAEYLPSDVRPYSATFDHYGSWRYEQVHGYVWYPRVHVGWRPYYRGRWVSLRPYGWTWIAGDPWGWPTHHYGRWGFSADAWFWIPGRRWGAAWVSWAHAPGYVSWCPLGWNDRPVFSFINVNVYGGRRYDPWHAWTVVPRRHFGSGLVNVNVVAGGRFDSRTRGSFVLRDSSPEWRYAVPRASAPIRAAGTRTGYAIPRGSTNSALSASDARENLSPGARSLPAPARQPRTPAAVTRPSERTSAPVTSAPQRAVPRDRSVHRETLSPPADRTGGVTAPGYRVSPQRRDPDAGRRSDGLSTVPPAGSRAVPRRAPDGEPQQTSEPNPGVPAARSERGGVEAGVPAARPERGGVEAGVPAARVERGGVDWGRYDRSPDRPASRTAPGSSPQPQWGGEGYRRAPERGGPDGSTERYRAVPRQDAPRSSEAPRAAPPRSYEAPRPAPERSYGSPRGESRPPSSGSAPERRGPSSSPSADRPSRSAPSGGEGQSRSRGGQPSQGQATRRPGGDAP